MTEYHEGFLMGAAAMSAIYAGLFVLIPIDPVSIAFGGGMTAFVGVLLEAIHPSEDHDQ